MGGNVETSSRVADVVLSAFGRALGQGTMNNVTLGDERVVYYETIGGGQGACPDADGPSAIHVAMSNTLNTPIEALELEFPLRMVRYALRPGLRRGRALPRRRRRDPRARGARAAALLADHRAPAARAAGRGGRGSGTRRGATCSTATSCRRSRSASSASGQRLRIETPGGGGYGSARLVNGLGVAGVRYACVALGHRSVLKNN